MGAKGTGKSSLLGKVLGDLRKSLTPNIPDTEKTGKELYEIHLSGLFQTDDRIALREIVRQLCLEREFEGQRLASFAECLAYILSVLKSGSADTIPIVFILDEIDLFAQHPKQSLLYNLFDAAQNSGSPIAVIGTTTRIDMTELLEKRVKSRFSHRFIHLLPAENMETFLEMVESGLCISEEDGVEDGEYVTDFNDAVKQLIRADPMKGLIRTVYDESKSIRDISRSLLTGVNHLTEESPFLDFSHVPAFAAAPRQDCKLMIVQALSVLELSLLVAVRQHALRQVDSFNFEMVYDDYREYFLRINLVDRDAKHLLFVKPVALKAFEHLIALELIKPVEGGGSRCPKEYRMMRSLMSPMHIEKAVLVYPNCPSSILRWGTST
ncbi:origin recognition complex subunit 4 [Rhizophlyctis rosea]|uniref:Origin recognition complex subunit 4 n=1 Tax=Rhizophlyctis rosea TaxID=64517 RepID=A0AAD5SAW8_9FUNG|nr:origin recognition complex subunit 4 [Rhizophlyctis rosea]